MSVNGNVPDWVAIAFGIGIFVALPLYSWLVAFPAAVKDRQRRIEESQCL